MKDFLERRDGAIGREIGRMHEEFRHFGLPAGVYFVLGHFREGARKVCGFDVTHQETVGPQEERVVAPARFTQSLLHFGPDRAMALLVLFEPLGAHLQHEADALH